jgi:hypothetical protein
LQKTQDGSHVLPVSRGLVTSDAHSRPSLSSIEKRSTKHCILCVFYRLLSAGGCTASMTMPECQSHLEGLLDHLPVAAWCEGLIFHPLCNNPKLSSSFEKREY